MESMIELSELNSNLNNTCSISDSQENLTKVSLYLYLYIIIHVIR